MGLKFIPDNTTFNFTGFRKVGYAFSSLAVIGSIVAFLMIGLNYGIDFRGGATIEVGPAEGQVFDEQSLSSVREAINPLDLGDAKITLISDLGEDAPQGMVVFLETQPEDREFIGICEKFNEEIEGNRAESVQQLSTSCVKEALISVLGDGIVERKVDVVGPAVSSELIEKGTMAVILAVVGVLIYIWYRFEWQFSLGAIVALVHDVVLTIGMFSVTGLEFNLSIIAALLTIVGYSLNDTVVVYDRVRENLRKYKKMKLPELLNLSINQTLSRTIMTSVTTLIALLALFIFGGTVLRGFTAAMIWGVVIGTYSSIFIASPILQMLGVKRDWSAEGRGHEVAMN